MQNLNVALFDEIQEEFRRRISQMVWCNVASIDTQGRPRSRILHPLWEDAVGWIAIRRNSFKGKHLEHNPYVSLAYVADVAKPVYVDCKAEWDDTMAAKEHVWNRCLTTPPPLGYDPAPIFGSVQDANFGILKLTPWRIEIANFPANRQIWHVAKEQTA